MPHIVLEYSANVVDTIELQRLFADLHQSLAELEAFPVADIKSRAHRLEHFYIGTGDSRQAMAHLCVSLMGGRDISVRQRIAQTGIRVLSNHFARSLTELDCQISIEVREMDRTTYTKQRGPGE